MRRPILSTLVLLVVAGCGDRDVSRIAVVLPLTGEYQIYGQPIRKGVELAFAELTESGDLALELSVVDSGSDAAKAAELLAAELGAGAYAAIGGVTTSEALAMVPVADRFNRVLISPSASGPQLTGISRNFYRVFPSDADEGTTMGVFVASKLQLEKVVIVAKEVTFARGIQEVFAAEFERNGGTVLEVIEYPGGSVDFSGLVERAVALEPQGIYLAAFADDVGAMIREIRRLGFEGRLFTSSAFSSLPAIEQLGGAAEGVFLTQAVFDAASPDPAVQSFVTRYREAEGFDPGLWAAHGYDAVMTLAKALENGRPPAGELWSSVRGLRDFSGVTGAIQFNERGDAQKYPRVYSVIDGELVDYEGYRAEEEKKIRDRIRKLEEEMRRRLAEGSGG